MSFLPSKENAENYMEGTNHLPKIIVLTKNIGPKRRREQVLKLVKKRSKEANETWREIGKLEKMLTLSMHSPPTTTTTAITTQNSRIRE